MTLRDKDIKELRSGSEIKVDRENSGAHHNTE